MSEKDTITIQLTQHAMDIGYIKKGMQELNDKMDRFIESADKKYAHQTDVEDIKKEQLWTRNVLVVSIIIGIFMVIASATARFIIK